MPGLGKRPDKRRETFPGLGKRPDKRWETFRGTGNATANDGTKNKKHV